MRFSWEEQGWAKERCMWASPLRRSIRQMMPLGGPSPGGVQKVPLGRYDLMPKSTAWGTEQGLDSRAYLPAGAQNLQMNKVALLPVSPVDSVIIS